MTGGMRRATEFVPFTRCRPLLKKSRHSVPRIPSLGDGMTFWIPVTECRDYFVAQAAIAASERHEFRSTEFGPWAIRSTT
jgi:hypothetical protein